MLYPLWPTRSSHTDLPVRSTRSTSPGSRGHHAATRDHTHQGHAGRCGEVKRGALEESRPLGHVVKGEIVAKEFQKFKMNGTLFAVPAFINRTSHVKTLIDCGSESYGLIDARIATRLQLP